MSPEVSKQKVKNRVEQDKPSNSHARSAGVIYDLEPDQDPDQQASNLAFQVLATARAASGNEIALVVAEMVQLGLVCFRRSRRSSGIFEETFIWTCK